MVIFLRTQISELIHYLFYFNKVTYSNANKFPVFDTEIYFDKKRFTFNFLFDSLMRKVRH